MSEEKIKKENALKRWLNNLKKFYSAESKPHPFRMFALYIIVSFLVPALVGVILAAADFCFFAGDFSKTFLEFMGGVGHGIVGVMTLGVQILTYQLSRMDQTKVEIKKSLEEQNKQIRESLNIHENVVNESLGIQKEQITGVLERYDDRIDNRIDKHFQNAKIVFETGIKDYDQNHLLALQRILNELDTKNIKTIYLTDYSDPIQWWSDSMTGYLSLLAKWRANKQERRVHRIFILSKNELLSPITIKTLAFHSLLGFNTYVFELDQYKALYKDYVEKNDLTDNHQFMMKELFIWRPEKEEVSHTVDFKIDKVGDWEGVLFYQSYWNINEPSKGIRKSCMENDQYVWKHHSGENKLSGEIDIWFDFVSNRNGYEKISNQYLGLIKYLRKHTFCCRKEGDVTRVRSEMGGMNFGVEIKTMACNSCGYYPYRTEYGAEKCKAINGEEKKFEYTNSDNIHGILNKYSQLV